MLESYGWVGGWIEEKKALDMGNGWVGGWVGEDTYLSFGDVLGGLLSCLGLDFNGLGNLRVEGTCFVGWVGGWVDG